MSEIIQVYKVLNGEYQSALAGLLPQKYRITYGLLEWVKPSNPRSPIFCFWDKDEALRWCKSLNRSFGNLSRVVEGFGQVSNVKVNSVAWNTWSVIPEDLIEKTWSKKLLEFSESGSLMPGSVLCDRVYLTKEIYEFSKYSKNP